MPLSGGGGFIPSGLLEELAGGAMGSPKVPYTRAATVELTGRRSRILPKADDVVRQVFVRNKTAEALMLFMEAQDIPMSIVQPGHNFHDASNSGIAVEAIGRGEIEIIIRSDQPINYEIGSNMTFPVEVALRIGTGDNFGYLTKPFQDDSSNIFDQNISKLFNSNDGITGHKLAVIHTFTPGAGIDFQVQVEGDRYDSTQAIQFQWINEIALLRLAIATASDVINPESELLSDGIGGLLTQGGWAGELPGEGGTISLRPNYMNFRGRFVAVDKQSGYYDTAIITRYEPNPDPFTGGTFTLEGF